MKKVHDCLGLLFSHKKVSLLVSIYDILKKKLFPYKDSFFVREITDNGEVIVVVSEHALLYHLHRFKGCLLKKIHNSGYQEIKKLLFFYSEKKKANLEKESSCDEKKVSMEKETASSKNKIFYFLKKKNINIDYYYSLYTIYRYSKR
jgi:hypothetical protein